MEGMEQRCRVVWNVRNQYRDLFGTTDMDQRYA